MGSIFKETRVKKQGWHHKLFSFFFRLFVLALWPPAVMSCATHAVWRASKEHKVKGFMPAKLAEHFRTEWQWNTPASNSVAGNMFALLTFGIFPRMDASAVGTVRHSDARVRA